MASEKAERELPWCLKPGQLSLVFEDRSGEPTPGRGKIARRESSEAAPDGPPLHQHDAHRRLETDSGKVRNLNGCKSYDVQSSFVDSG